TGIRRRWWRCVVPFGNTTTNIEILQEARPRHPLHSVRTRRGVEASVLNENTRFRPSSHHKAATPERGMEGLDLQHRLGSSRLVRLLQEWAQVDGESARQDVAERLSHWLSAFDAVKLD